MAYTRAPEPTGSCADCASCADCPSCPDCQGASSAPTVRAAPLAAGLALLWLFGVASAATPK